MTNNILIANYFEQETFWKNLLLSRIFYGFLFEPFIINRISFVGARHLVIILYMLLN